MAIRSVLEDEIKKSSTSDPDDSDPFASDNDEEEEFENELCIKRMMNQQEGVDQEKRVNIHGRE